MNLSPSHAAQRATLTRLHAREHHLHEKLPHEHNEICLWMAAAYVNLDDRSRKWKEYPQWVREICQPKGVLCR